MPHAAQKNILDLSADEILAIKAENPEALFQPDMDAITSDFRALSKKWFPDLCSDPKAADVQRHLLELRKIAQEKLLKNEWREDGYYKYTLLDGRTLRVRSDAERSFELGLMHIGPTAVTYVVSKDYADLFANAVAMFGNLTFPDDKIKDVYAPRLPTQFKTYETPENLILTVRKGKEEVLLRDALPYMAKENLDRHVAWTMSRLHEFARYFDHVGIVHNAITLDNVFVSLLDHTASVYGGWWYATPVNGTMKAIPAEAHEFLDDEAFATGQPNLKVDLEMIRAVGRELLGDRGGTRLPSLNVAPSPMIDYLRMPTRGDAQQDLSHWYQDVLVKSFGGRKFIELKVTYRDVYQPKGG